jgi:uncharacterized protein (DUF2164 family)
MAADPLKGVTRDDLAAGVRKLQGYLQKEFELEIGALEAEALMSFVAGQVYPLVYNAAIEDARTLASSRMQTLDEELLGLER